MFDWLNHAIAKEEYKEGLSRIKRIEEKQRDKEEAFDRFRSLFFDFYWKFDKYVDFYENKERALSSITSFFHEKKLEMESIVQEAVFLNNKLRSQVASFEQWKSQQEEQIEQLQKYYKESAEAMNSTVEFLNSTQRNEVDKLNHALKAREKTGRQLAFNEMVNYLVYHFDMDRDELIESLKIKEEE